LSISSSQVLEGLAEALMDLAELGLKVPFLVALPGLGGKEFIVSFSTARSGAAPDQGQEVRRLLKKHLPEARPMRLTPVAGIFLHGPHFGDRYGIAQTLLEALGRARVTLLALSCTISSVSLIIRQQELAQAQLVLTQTFAAPVECAPAATG
jgi:aspartokinase